jgi:hypothetical protein
LAAGQPRRRQHVSRLLLQTYFFRPEQISPRPSSLVSTCNFGWQALPSRGIKM